MEILLPILAVIVLVAGLSVVVVNRRRAESQPGLDPTDASRAPAATTPTREVDDAARPTDEAVEPAAEADVDGDSPVATTEAVDEELTPTAKPSFFERLAKARSTFAGYLGSVLSRSDITEETWEELEEALIRADVGVALTTSLLDELRGTVKEKGIIAPEELVDALKDELKAKLSQGDRTLHFEAGRPNVWLFVGVNGVGKTTSIGKVAAAQVAEGRKVIMAAGDTFRAAAAEQLHMWSERAGTDFHRGEEGGDPSSVIFDAVAKAGARDYDFVLADTAGRLHTKTNLMEELAKVRRVADREPGKVTEVLLVLDATTGQNGMAQARQFSEATDCTGVVLTKLDGSAKGGIALAIALDLGLPIKLVGLGEQIGDLIEFDPNAFVDALFEV